MADATRRHFDGDKGAYLATAHAATPARTVTSVKRKSRPNHSTSTTLCPLDELLENGERIDAFLARTNLRIVFFAVSAIFNNNIDRDNWVICIKPIWSGKNSPATTKHRLRCSFIFRWPPRHWQKKVYNIKAVTFWKKVGALSSLRLHYNVGDIDSDGNVNICI